MGHNWPISRVLGLDLVLFGPILSLNRRILGIWDWIWAISGGPVPEFGPFRGSWAYFEPKSVHFGDLGLDLGHFEGSLAWIWPCIGPILSLNPSIWGIWDWIWAI